MNDKKLGTVSTAFLFLNLCLAKHLLVVPSFMVNVAGNAAWIAVLVKGTATLALFAVAAALYKPYVEVGFGELTRRAVGKFLGGAVNIVFAAVALARGAFLFRTLAEALRMLEVESASIEYMSLFILIPVFVCAMKGFNVSASMSTLVIPFTLISVAAVAAALVPHFELPNLMPIFGEGTKSIISVSILSLGGFMEMIYLFVFSDMTSGYKSFKKGGLWGIAAITLIMGAFLLMYCAAIPYPASKKFFFPLYQLTRLIKASSFMQRLEPLAVFVWAGIALCSLSTGVIGISRLLAQSGGEGDGHGFVPMVTLMLLLVGALPKSDLTCYEIYRFVLNISHYIYIPLIFIILLIARGRKIETA